MSPDKTCPDCDAAMERMKLQGTDFGNISIVSEGPKEGFLSSIRADEILTPIPYVCPDCHRTLFYAEG